MPSYNAAPYIERCLRSLREQSFDRFEAVIIDDRSTDGTYELLQELSAGDERITLRSNETNLGAVKNFQQLLGHARGDYINFVCCDDLLRKDCFERKVALLEQRQDVAIVAGNKLVVDHDDQPIADRNEYIWSHTPFGTNQSTFVVDGFEAGDTMLLDLNNWIGEPTAAMFRNGVLSPDDPYVLGSARPVRNLDFCWWLKLMAGSQLGYVNEPLSYFRHHAGQQSKDSALLADLTLAWYDVVVGAISLGYLESPAAQIAAFKRVAAHIESRLPQLIPDHLERIQGVLRNISQRLDELVGQHQPAVQERS
jgi:glycosyltransferase involved in cell wall biosynthesis